jgi:hypothetical protein
MLLRDTPRPGFEVPVCLSRLEAHPELYSEVQCDIRPETALSPGVWKAERGAAKGLPSVSTLDLSDQFCNGTNCSTVLHGKVVYRDGNHIAAQYSALLATVLSERLARTM